MTTPHLLLLSMLTGAALCIFWQLLTLLRRGALRARETGLSRESARANDGFNTRLAGQHFFKWRELSDMARTPWRLRKRCKQSVRYWISLLHLDSIAPNTEPKQRRAVIDPLDGTAFEPQEAVVRCSCGTVYHEDSWQWIGEKNGAKCVNCKKVGVVTHGCVDDLTGGVSSFARSFGESLS
jgi:hypothetical protein